MFLVLNLNVDNKFGIVRVLKPVLKESMNNIMPAVAIGDMGVVHRY